MLTTHPFQVYWSMMMDCSSPMRMCLRDLTVAANTNVLVAGPVKIPNVTSAGNLLGQQQEH
jgi:hypothetical protein